MISSIRSKMWLSSGIVFLLTLISGFQLLSTYRKIPVHLQQTQRVNEMVQQIFILANALNDFYFRRLPQAVTLWERSHALLGRRLQELSREDLPAPATIDELIRTHREVGRSFEALLEAIDREEPDFTRRLLDQIQFRLQDMVLLGHLLVDQKQAELEAALRAAEVVIMLFMVVISLIVASAVFFFHKTVLNPLRLIQSGLETVARGNLDHEIRYPRQDEMGQLADGFNRMSRSLKDLSQARDTFLSTAAHELKTPLTVLKAYVQLMQRWSPERREGAFAETVGVLDHQCRRLERLVRDLLEVSRAELDRIELQIRKVSFDQLVSQIVGETQRVSPKHQLVVTRNDRVEVSCDRDRVEQVLLNLLDNAVKYSPGGGRIDVEAGRLDGQVRVSVRDYGIGIPKEKQSQIFERFYRAHAGTPYDYRTSLGIGLFLAKEFVTRHRGEIGFESCHGRGSSFYFTLPIESPVA